MKEEIENTRDEAIAAVTELNDSMWLASEDESLMAFQFHTDGTTDWVTFMDFTIWNEDEDERDTDSEGFGFIEGIKPFLKRRAEEILAKMTRYLAREPKGVVEKLAAPGDGDALSEAG